MNNEGIESYPLIEYVYPVWIKAFLIIVFLTFLCVVTVFFNYEFSYHVDLSKKMTDAEQAFFDKEYDTSFELYQELLSRHSNFKKAKIRLAELCFIISLNNDENYMLGLAYLNNETFKNEEVSEMKSYLPEKFKDNFNSIFTS